VAGTDSTVGQTSHRLINEALADELRQAVHAGPSIADQADSIRYRVSAVLYLLLRDHSIDRRGRCRSCRRPGAMITIRRQPCRILIKARYWLLRPPDEAQLLSLLAAELPATPHRRPARAKPTDRSTPAPTSRAETAASTTPTCCPPTLPSLPPPRSCPGTGRPNSLQNQTGAHPNGSVRSRNPNRTLPIFTLIDQRPGTSLTCGISHTWYGKSSQ
jgi:hypothetical protein